MKIEYVFFTLFIFQSCDAQQKQQWSKTSEIRTGAAQTEKYLKKIRGKRVGLIVNQTSMVDSVHLVDTLLQLGIDIQKIFAPEHGFRGNASAGATIQNSKDIKTGLPIISLYGKNKKPTKEMLKNIDILLFDIQDVGVRFYTYISTMHLAMQASAEQNIKFFVLDRPNPNGFFVDGPTLDSNFTSFIGMHPIPLVHGCTVGELAKMINGEDWLGNKLKCNLQVVSCENYSHASFYVPEVQPSPNLPNIHSIYFYPTLGLFEGTKISVGRGTQFPFQQIGWPNNPIKKCLFKPISMPGVANSPKFENKNCFGQKFSSQDYGQLRGNLRIDLLITYFKNYSDKEAFFLKSFDLLAGTKKLRIAIQNGISANEIRKSWSSDIETFLIKRGKYLLYPIR